jgi:hypothetical protein
MLYAHMRFDGPTELSHKRTPPMEECDASREFFVDRFTYLEVSELLESKELKLSAEQPEDEILFLIDLNHVNLNRGFVSYATSKLRPPGVYMSFEVRDDPVSEPAKPVSCLTSSGKPWEFEERKNEGAKPAPKPASGFKVAAKNFWEELRWFNQIAKESMQWPWD